MDQEGSTGRDSHALLAQLLSYARPRENPEVLASALLDRFGTLADLLNAPTAMLLQVPKLDRSAVTLLKLALSLTVRASATPLLPGEPVLDLSHIEALWAIDYLSNPYEERVDLASLDSDRRLLRKRRLAAGPLHTPEILQRLVISQALAADASYVILAQSHTSGRSRPTRTEIETTHCLAALLAEVGVTLVDHVVFGPTRLYSMAEHGLLLPPANTPCFPPAGVV